MQIKEIMSKQVITVKRSTTFTQLVKLCRRYRVGKI